MTAEIAIINRQGIALAADSAVTIGRDRVWKSANKLFSLGPRNDIAMMIYNAGDFVGIPWETIIKSFRLKVSDRQFKKIKDCEEEFFKYLNSDLFSVSNNSDMSITSILINFIDIIKMGCEGKSRKDKEAFLDVRLDEILTETDTYYDAISDVIPFEDFKKQYKDDIKVICKDIFDCSLKNAYIDRIVDCVYKIVRSKRKSVFMSGLVFAGFGTEQMLPYISHYTVDGRFSFKSKSNVINYTRFWLNERIDFSTDANPSALILPFAQTDMFYMFMEGIIQKHLSYIKTILSSVLAARTKSLIHTYVPQNEQMVEEQLQEAENETLVEEFDKEFDDFRHKTLVSPVLDVIGALPKEEMASMAEALVELTALRRKVGSNLETVGGPTDVAIISKGDGLIWAKRKHYFNPELNGDFEMRKKLQFGENHD